MSEQLTVKELISLLLKYNPDLKVWLTISDDPDDCFKGLVKNDIKLGDINIQSGALGESKEESGIIIGEANFFP